MRGQHPNSGTPGGWALAVAFALVAISIAWSAVPIRRAGAGVSGPAQRKKRAWLGGMLLAWIIAYLVTAPLYHAGDSHPVRGLYPASAPLMIIGVAGAVTAPAWRDWSMAVTCIAVAFVAALAGFGGPAGAWLIMGIGLSTAMRGAAAFTAWWQRRGMVRP